MRVHTKTKSKGGKAPSYHCCRCDKPIVPGQKYYEYKHRYSAPNRRHVEHGAPRQSEMVSGKMSGVYAAIEGAEEAISVARAAGSPEGLDAALTSAAEEVENVRQEYEDGLGNMPDSLQQSSSGEAIQEKIDGLEEFKDTLENAASEVEAFISEWEGMDEPETMIEHTDDCASNEEAEPEEEGGESTGEMQPCDCGYDDADTKYEEWEREREEKADEAFDAAENALQELSI